MNKLTELVFQKNNLNNQIAACYSIAEYPVLKSKLKAVERDIAVVSGGYQNWKFVQKLIERIDELETNKAKAMIEKNKCRNITQYRKLIDSIELIEQSIDSSNVMLTKAMEA